MDKQCHCTGPGDKGFLQLVPGTLLEVGTAYLPWSQPRFLDVYNRGAIKKGVPPYTPRATGTKGSPHTHLFIVHILLPSYVTEKTENHYLSTVGPSSAH
jgi:hypothetical protein